MKYSLFSFLLFLSANGFAQTDPNVIINDTKAFQEELNNDYKNKSSSPLTPGDLKKFEHHDFFEIDVRYVVTATLRLTPESLFSPMAATGSVVNDYRSYAIATFELEGKKCELTLYQSKSLMKKEEYKDYLFLPFTDETTGSESYSGGRYLEVRIPKEGSTITLNFNKAYNPYCAYNSKYSCPLVPRNNNLPLPVKAGVKFVNK